MNCRLSAEHLFELKKLYKDVLLHKVRVAGDAVQVENEFTEGQLSCDDLREYNCLHVLESGLKLLCRLLSDW